MGISGSNEAYPTSSVMGRPVIGPAILTTARPKTFDSSLTLELASTASPSHSRACSPKGNAFGAARSRLLGEVGGRAARARNRAL